MTAPLVLSGTDRNPYSLNRISTTVTVGMLAVANPFSSPNKSGRKTIEISSPTDFQHREGSSPYGDVIPQGSQETKVESPNGTVIPQESQQTKVGTQKQTNSVKRKRRLALKQRLLPNSRLVNKIRYPSVQD